MGVCVDRNHALQLSSRLRKNLNCKFEFNNVASPDVLNSIKSITNKTTEGWDEIPVDPVRIISQYVAEPLNIVISQSFEMHFSRLTKIC